MSALKKCAKCRKNISVEKYDKRDDGDYYSTCKPCRIKNNKQSLKSYRKNAKAHKCEYCEKSYKVKKVFENHLWLAHDIGTGTIYECSDCDYQTKHKRSFNKHIEEHDPEKEIFKCEHCNRRCFTKDNLKKHLLHTHHEGKGTGKLLKCSHCTNGKSYETYNKHYLKKHIWGSHGIGTRAWHNCDKCASKFTSNEELKAHVWSMHTENNKSFVCEICGFSCTTKGNLTQHKWNRHNVGNGKWYSCDKCGHKTKTNSTLKSHMWHSHDINTGNFRWLKCEHCQFQCKAKGNLVQHIWRRHNKGKGKLFKCEECGYIFKSKSHLKRHLSLCHDEGPHSCEICIGNVFNLINYHDKTTDKKLKICRKCYNKATGCSTRKEEQMVKYLEKDDKIKPYIILKDKILKGHACNTRRRPDMYISSTNDLHIIIECDENQHKGYIYDCETGRMDELLDEMQQGRVIFIRWNPDYCKLNGKRFSKKREERLKLLKELILHVVQKKDWKDDENIMVYYMFYDKDNEVITKRLKHKLIYERSDFITSS